MSNYFILTKVMLKNLNLFGFGSGKSSKSRIKAVLLSVLILVSFLPMIIGIGTLAFGGYHVLSDIQQEGLILGMGFSLSSLIVFFFGIFYVMSFFYFSNDILSLLPLPLKPSEILASKFTVMMFYEYLTELVFLVPILIGFGIASNAGFVYYLYSFFLFLMLPVLPLIYASVISMLVMGFTGFAKNKDRYRMIGGIISLFLAIGLNTYITRISSSTMNAAELQQLLAQGNNSYVRIMSGIFFSNRFAVMALLHNTELNGIVNLAIFVFICLLFVLLFLSLGESIYFRGVSDISETSVKRRKYSEKELRRSSKEKSPLKSYTIKELMLLFRTPIYFLNCVIINFLLPFFMIFPFLMQPDEMKELQKLGNYIADGRGSAVVLAAAFASSVFITSTNSISASAISREGANIYVCKYLPVSYKTQIMAKALPGMFMGMAGTLMMMLGAVIFVPVPFYLILLASALSILGIVFSSFIGILIDLNFPKLVWDNEQKAVKQNFNVVLNMIANVIIAGIPVFVTIALHFTLRATFLTLAAVFAILDLLLYNILSEAGSRLFEKIEI